MEENGYGKLARAVLNEHKRQIWPKKGGITLAEVIEKRLNALPLWKGHGGKEEPRRKSALCHIYGLPVQGQKGRKLSSTSITSQGAIAIQDLKKDSVFCTELSRFLVSTPDEVEQKVQEITDLNEQLRVEKEEKERVIKEAKEECKKRIEPLEQKIGELGEQLETVAKQLHKLTSTHTQMFGGIIGKIALFLLQRRVKQAPQ